MEHNEIKPLTSKKRSLIFVCLVVSGIASSTLATAMTTALPDLVRYFGISTSLGQWVTSGYSLAMGVIMPLTAFLITRFPYQKAVYDRDRRLYRGPFVQHFRPKLWTYDGGQGFAGLR